MLAGHGDTPTVPVHGHHRPTHLQVGGVTLTPTHSRKARAAFVMLKNILASGGISMRTKLRIFNSNVKSVLLYGCETWRTTQTMQQKIQTLFNTCLRCIYKIQWQEKIRNKDLWERAGQEPVAKQILRRKWGWIRDTLRKPASSTHTPSPDLEPAGEEKERTASQQLGGETLKQS